MRSSQSDLFGPALAELRDIAPGKPVVISEIASTGVGGSKADWIGQAVAFLDAQPDVVGFVWFSLRKEADWRLDDSPESAAAFRAALEGRS